MKSKGRLALSCLGTGEKAVFFCKRVAWARVGQRWSVGGAAIPRSLHPLPPPLSTQPNLTLSTLPLRRHPSNALGPASSPIGVAHPLRPSPAPARHHHSARPLRPAPTWDARRGCEVADNAEIPPPRQLRSVFLNHELTLPAIIYSLDESARLSLEYRSDIRHESRIMHKHTHAPTHKNARAHTHAYVYIYIYILSVQFHASM